MKPYGVKRQDRGCCAGHDKYPHPKTLSNRGKRRKLFKDWSRIRKKRARRWSEED